MVEKELATLMTQEVLNPLKPVSMSESISEEIQRLQRRVIVQLEPALLKAWGKLYNRLQINNQGC